MIYLLSDLFLVQESCKKPTIKNKPERIIINCETKNVKNHTPQPISDNILSLAKSIQQENNIVLVSSIVPRKYHLGKIGKKRLKSFWK